MADFTKNYSLIRPSDADAYDVGDFNSNMDTIDTALYAAETKAAKTEQAVSGLEKSIAAVDAKLGTPADTGTATVFGRLSRLEREGSVMKGIRSLQYHVYEVTRSAGRSGSIPLSPAVDPKKSFVLFERLKNTPQGLVSVEYTLTENALVLSHDAGELSGAAAVFGFWVIECA